MFIVMALTGVSLSAQITNIKKIMYVNSREGLRVRSEPSIDGDKIKTLLYGERIIIHAKTDNNVTIDEITDCWYSIDYRNETWVFGGYLSEEFPSDAPVVLGLWDDINNERQYYLFEANHDYAEGYKETDMGVWGRWNLDRNKITIHLTGAGNAYELDETIEVQLIIIDKNNINLKFPNNELIKLKRSQEFW
jgi:hypothetical protein